jgi:transposase
MKKRMRFVEALRQGVELPLIWDELNISRSTAFSWRTQWESKGVNWLTGKRRGRYALHLTPGLKWNPIVIKAISLQNPDWGCDRIAETLVDFGVKVSSPTVQKILIELELGKEHERQNEIEIREVLAEFCDGPPLTEFQKNFLAKMEKQRRPEFAPADSPGKILVQDTCIGGKRLFGAAYRGNVIVDTFDNQIFCRLNDNSWRASDTIHAIDEVIAIFKQRNIKVGKVITDQGREFGADGLNYRKFLVTVQPQAGCMGLPAKALRNTSSMP